MKNVWLEAVSALIFANVQDLGKVFEVLEYHGCDKGGEAFVANFSYKEYPVPWKTKFGAVGAIKESVGDGRLSFYKEMVR